MRVGGRQNRVNGLDQLGSCLRNLLLCIFCFVAIESVQLSSLHGAEGEMRERSGSAAAKKFFPAREAVNRCASRWRDKEGAKKAANVYASEVYAGPVVPWGARRAPQYQVEEPGEAAEGPVPCGGAVMFTPPPRTTKARHQETSPRLLRLCATHHHTQCATCAGVGKGVQGYCARDHA